MTGLIFSILKTRKKGLQFLSSLIKTDNKFIILYIYYYYYTDLFDHLILVLDEELNAFDWGRSGLRANGGYPRKSKVFSEGKLVS